eukprot:gnl/MRDRNA2_/MRDRNA2_70735_c0_seq2.p1 gnl/MRDRNA2_/MRDRNA2_70735_c0~~gnl/MRDRNA2_/MRDRNA2_70735_c0_seq2.p1  ORF type:complete len:204 (+),score=43.72 gnl/MRDRNA2_/MRDRNA2_70735_c0_seq2:116-727(+)
MMICRLTKTVCLSILACASAGTVKQASEGLTTGQSGGSHGHGSHNHRNGHGGATLKTQYAVKEVKVQEHAKPVESGPVQGLEIFQHTMSNIFENMPGAHPWRKEAREKKAKEQSMIRTEEPLKDPHTHPFQKAMKEVIRMAIDAKGEVTKDEHTPEREIENPELVHALLKAAQQPWGTIPAGINALMQLEKDDAFVCSFRNGA